MDYKDLWNQRYEELRDLLERDLTMEEIRNMECSLMDSLVLFAERRDY